MNQRTRLFTILSTLSVLPVGALVAATAFTFSTLAGTPGSVINSVDGIGSAAQFDAPRGVAIDTAGNVYVADGSNNTIRKVSPAGEVTTLAGTAGSAGSSDGTGTAARFNEPFGIAVDSSGTLYVADSSNNAIRRVTAAGVVTTFAGGGGPAARTAQAPRRDSTTLAESRSTPAAHSTWPTTTIT